jgi:Glycosyltransferase 61
MLTALPLFNGIRKRLLRRPPLRLEEVAEQIIEIAPAETSIAPPAFYLPDQLDRVTGWEFADEHPRRAMQGNREASHAPTRAFRLKRVFVVDGALHKGALSLHYRPRQRSILLNSIDRSIESGAVYCSAPGLKYFANWLSDDCVCYPLAKAEGTPLSLTRQLDIHTLDYEHLLGMSPERVEQAFIRDAVVFEDFGQNANKRARAGDLRRKILASLSYDCHPGVFIIRGTSGSRRILVNEMEIAHHLQKRRGFRILDPVHHGVREIVAACAGAQVVVGVEGSGLMHGVCMLQPGGGVLTLQPPNRFVCYYKDLADRNGQHFGFVVGFPLPDDAFRIDIDEVERTLDLFPPCV